MVRLVEFPQEIERETRFVEETPPDRVVAATLERLNAGAPAKTLFTAAALAVSRSSELPPDHHGGPVHPVSGLHATLRLAQRLDGASRHLPVVQSVALANKHIHAPDMGPAAMARLEPVDGESTAELLEGFARALGDRKARAAERHLVALAGRAAPGEILDAIMTVALPRNALDDRYVLYPLFAARALDAIGWEWASVLLRPPVRYLAGHPMMEAIAGFKPEVVADGVRLYQEFDALERLIDDHGLGEDTIERKTDEAESDAIGALAGAIGAIGQITRIAGMLAKAMAEGLSLDGAGEALSIGGAMLFLRSHTGNPFDVHIHTGINARRYLIRLKGVAVRTKLLALLGWCYGAEVRHLDRTLRWAVRAEVTSRLPERGESELLDAIEESITRQPVVELDAIAVEVNDLVAPAEVRTAVALAQAYADAGYDAEASFRLLGGLTSRDDASEMHAYKLQQAAHEEYHATREPYRWVHLVSAAKHAACVVQMQPKSVYPRTRALL